MKGYDEDALVQKPIVDILKDVLGWQSVYAYNTEKLGSDGTTGRDSEREIVLKHRLRPKLVEFNPGLPNEAYDDALRQIMDASSSMSMVAINQEKQKMIRDGVQVSFRNSNGKVEKQWLEVIDFNDPERNEFLCVRELWIQGPVYRKRTDIMGFVNGIPVLFCECKNIDKPVKYAYDQNYTDYKDTVPHIFHHNAIVMLSNGERSVIGSITSGFEHFHEWKRLDEDDEATPDLETLLRSVCEKSRFLDIIENFVIFDDAFGETRKILAKNHQYLGVNRTVEAIQGRKELGGKIGVFWHTQGAGKSYAMVFLTRKVHRKLSGSFTFLIVTDRTDLDDQIYKTFAGCGVVDNDKDPCRAADGDHLEKLLGKHKSHIFTLIQKFRKDVDPNSPYTIRDDIIVITDEAHRTQYGTLALNLRNALPKANFLGFTGTPLFREDELTRKVFGDYVSKYDFQRAVDDGATVPLYFDPRGKKLEVAIGDINEKIAAAIEEAEIEDRDVEIKLERALKKNYHVITKPSRLEDVARDVVDHYSRAWESGKAMVVCLDKLTCIKIHDLVTRFWLVKIDDLKESLPSIEDEEEWGEAERRIEWMEETLIAPIFSEEQNEVGKFRDKGFDIVPHRSLIKQGFELHDGSRMDVETAFKNDSHPFRLAIVCAMWLTGFDVPSLSTLYLDKPLKEHTLMQAIARANRVKKGKDNGMIVDYCGVLDFLFDALAIYAGMKSNGSIQPDQPTRPQEDLLEALEEAIEHGRSFLSERGANLGEVVSREGLERLQAIQRCKEAANENDGTRREFEIICREANRRFKACINAEGVNVYRRDSKALTMVYRSLQSDREEVDINDILESIQSSMEDSIVTVESEGDDSPPIDISAIDFDSLSNRLSMSPRRNTETQNLRHAVEERLRRMLNRNTLRTDFQEHYEQIVAKYNDSKDRATVERIFRELLELANSLDEEEARAAREGLDEESLAIFDILRKADLEEEDINRVINTSICLLRELKEAIEQIDNWTSKEQMRDQINQTIFDHLYDDSSGLPETYTDTEIEYLSDEVYRHVYRVYRTIPSPVYA